MVARALVIIIVIQVKNVRRFRLSVFGMSAMHVITIVIRMCVAMALLNVAKNAMTGIRLMMMNATIPA